MRRVGAAVLALALAAPALAGPLDYARKPFAARVELVKQDRSGREYLVRFPSVLKSPFKPDDTVWGHLLLPPGPGPFAAVLVLPVMAAPNIWIESRFINRFREDGLAVLWLEMPYQFHRRPSALIPSGSVFLARNPQVLAFNFRQSALDARRAIDWLCRQPEIDRTRLGVFGVSLGALVGSVVYSVDARLRYAVFLLGGADFPSLVMKSSMTGAFVAKLGTTPAKLRALWKGLDSLDYAAQNADKPALLINAMSDTVIPASNARALKKAFPKARQLWVPFGHYTAILHLIWVPRYIGDRFVQHLVKSR